MLAPMLKKNTYRTKLKTVDRNGYKNWGPTSKIFKLATCWKISLSTTGLTNLARTSWQRLIVLYLQQNWTNNTRSRVAIAKDQRMDSSWKTLRKQNKHIVQSQTKVHKIRSQSQQLAHGFGSIGTFDRMKKLIHKL